MANLRDSILEVIDVERFAEVEEEIRSSHGEEIEFHGELCPQLQRARSPWVLVVADENHLRLHAHRRRPRARTCVEQEQSNLHLSPSSPRNFRP